MKTSSTASFTKLILAFLLESSDGLSFFIGLFSSSNSKASLGLDGADGDLNEDSIGETGLGCPAGNDEMPSPSQVSSHLQRELSASYLVFLLHLAFSLPSLFNA